MNGKRWMVIAALGLATALSVPAVAQDRDDHDRDDHDRGRYEQRDHDRDGDRDRGYPNGGYYSGGNYSWRNNAHQFGYQDGINDGRHDRQDGHNFQPTHGGNYKHANRGYDSHLGSKEQYKDAYRQAYEDGYQRGYHGR